MAEYKQTEHSVRKLEKKQQMVADELDQVEELQRKNNILIFGLEEEENESHFDTTEAVAKFFKDTIRLKMAEGSIDFIMSLGRRRSVQYY
jgi:Fic family protein